MIRWAVTGPTGAGKSRLTGLLAARGAAVVDGDTLGHEVLARDQVQAAIAREFGPGFVVDGAVDRRALGAVVFADAEAMMRLNRITHGPLAERAAERLEALARGRQHVLAVFEAAVYFLLPSPPAVDMVITVTAPPAVRAARLVAKLGLAAEEAAARVAFQSFMEEGWGTADLIFDNSGDEAALESFAAELWSRLPAP